MKDLYFIYTNGYNMIVYVDENKNCKYLTETEDFPYLLNLSKEEQIAAAKKFLNSIEDDSSWENDVSYDCLFTKDVEIIAMINKKI